MTAQKALVALYDIIGSCYPHVPSVQEYAVQNVSPEETLRVMRKYTRQTDAAFRMFGEVYGNHRSIYNLFRTLSPEVVYSFNCRLVTIEAYLQSAPAGLELPVSPDPAAYILDTMVALYHRITPQHETLVRKVYQQVLGRLRQESDKAGPSDGEMSS